MVNFDLISKMKFSRSMKAIGKAYRDARPKAMQAVGQFWHKDILPKHFETSATDRYGYAPRTKPYMIRKAKHKGHQKPLVWSGTLRRTLMGAVRVTATASTARVKMSGPPWIKGYISFKGKKGTGPDKKKEILTVTNEERQQMAELSHSVLADAMNNASGDPLFVGSSD